MPAMNDKTHSAPPLGAPPPDRAELFSRAAGDDLAREFGLERLLDLLSPETAGRTPR